jgi:hypothetical protein
MVKRRKFLIGAGSLFAGGAAATGTGAFTEMESNKRAVDIRDVSDENGLIGLGPAGFSDDTEDQYPNSVYVESDTEDGNEVVRLDFTPDGTELGFNEKGTFYLDEVLEIHLSDDLPTDQSYNIRIQDNIQGFTPYTGTGNNRDMADFGVDLGTLAPGESIYVGWKVEAGSDNFFGGSGIRINARPV